MAYLATSADLIQRTYQWFREPSATPTFWPSAHVVDLLDEAQATVTRDFWLSRAEWFTNTSAASAGFVNGAYSLPDDLLILRHVLYLRDNGTNTKYSVLGPKGVNDLLVGNYQASGTATNYALIGYASAAQTAWTLVGGGTPTITILSPVIYLWPAPDTSALSGLYVIGSRTPDSLSVSASNIPRQIIDLVPAQAALRGWQERGNDEEVKRLTGIYDTRLSAWRQSMADMGLDEQDAMEFKTFDSGNPHAGTLRPVMLTPNPLWP